LTANVTSGATGKVTFYDGVTILGVGAVSNGQATLSTVMLASGKRSLHAHYSGDAVYAPSNSVNVPQSVVAGTSLGFHKPVSYSWTNNFATAVVGDFNGDGYQDLALANPAVDAITIFLGNGDGTFAGGVNYPITSAPNILVVGDFNGDGRTDLAVTYGSTDQVGVLLGNGDGTFQPVVNYPAGVSQSVPAVGDFNGDGVADLAVAGFGGSVSILIGNGDGSFQAPVLYPGGAALSVAVADLNNDGKPDLAVATYGGGINVLLGNGDGTFAAPVNYPMASGSYAISIAAGDLNGDGSTDLVVAAYDLGSINVFLGNGEGGFLPAVSYPCGSYPAALFLADFNGDGNTDIAFSTSSGPTVFLGNGDGTFQTGVNYPVGPWFVLGVGDFNRDAKADLVVGAASGFQILFGGATPDLTVSVSHGRFTEGQQNASYIVTVSNVGDAASVGAVRLAIDLPAGISAAGLGGTGWTCVLASQVCNRSDAVPAGGSYPAITLQVNVANDLTGNATSTFTVSGGSDQTPDNNTATDTTFVRYPTVTTLISSPNPATFGHPVTLTAAVVSQATGSVTFYAGATVLGSATLVDGQATLTTSLLPSGISALRAEYQGDPTFGPSHSAAVTQTVNAIEANGYAPYRSYKVQNIGWIGVGDFNGDGKPDIITATNLGVSVLLGNGDGTFQAAVNSTITGGLEDMNGAIIGDFNGDGRQDVVVATGYGLYFLPGNGDGTFQASVQLSPNYCGSVVAADFNSDGKLDLVVNQNGNILLLLGNGDGTFQPPAAITNLSGYSGIVLVADVNGDGKPDLVSPGPTILLGNGDGTFQAPLYGLFGGNAYAVGDFNGDGKVDFAWTGVNQVGVLLGFGDGTFQTPIDTNLSYLPGYSMIAADFNGDGKLDIAYPEYAGNNIAIAFGKGDGTFQYGGYLSGTQFATDGIPYGMVQADFNGDGKPDLAVVTSAGTVDVFLGGQYSGLIIAVTHAGSFTSDATGAYQIVIQNPAFASTSGTVTVTDTLPNGLTATAIGGTGWACTLNTLTCTRSDALGTGAGYPTIAIAVNVAGLAPTTLTNTASVSYGGIANPAADPTSIVSPTTTSLAVSPNPASLSQLVTMTATVSAGASGTVLFLDAGSPLGSAAVSGGQAIFTTTLLASGLRAISATYSGDTTHASSISGVAEETVTASQTSDFAAASNYPTGASPSAMAIGDFNGDGKADLVTANSDGNSISVLLNNGDGTFAPHVDYPAGVSPMAVVVGDFNRDGKPDIAVGNLGSISILLGNGDGTFQPAVNYDVASALTLVAGDFNSDGRIDLAAGNGSSGITMLFGNGDGTFNAANPVSANGAVRLSVGDFNRDGKGDIAYLTYWNSPYVLLGNGDGTFANPVSVNEGSVVTNVLGDLNADGKQDIVGASGLDVSVVLGNGDGTFRNYVQYSGGDTAWAITIADVNGDGNQDVVIASNFSLLVLFGNGDGTLQAPVSYSGVGNGPSAIVAGDFNGDGKTDLAIANGNGASVTVVLGILAPVLTVTSSHTDPFSIGQTNAAYSFTLTNNGPVATSGAIAVTDTLPAGMIATNIAGTGWTCTLATVSCTRSDSLGVGKSYQPIVVTVTVGSISNSSVTNEVTATGGGAVTTTALDLTAIMGVATTLQTNPSGLYLSVDGGSPLVSPQTVNLLSGSHSIAVASPQAGSAGTQYVFTQWSDFGATSHIIAVATAPATYTATFKTQYRLTTSINPWPAGTVTPASGSFFDAGSTVTLTATPASPYVFTAWSGDASGFSTQTTVTMNAAESITALFNVPGFTCAITGDQTPSVADVQMIVNEALGVADPAHDLNHDNVVNIGDIQKLIDAVLGYECPY
jgi:uncharacterized repeat protein (TIGR01451 family)